MDYEKEGLKKKTITDFRIKYADEPWLLRNTFSRNITEMLFIISLL